MDHPENDAQYAGLEMQEPSDIFWAEASTDAIAKAKARKKHLLRQDNLVCCFLLYFIFYSYSLTYQSPKLRFFPQIAK